MEFFCLPQDEEIPVSNFNQYKKDLTQATFQEIKDGGYQFNSGLALVDCGSIPCRETVKHQFNSGLALVARDIKSL